ncbi:MAG: hypothetical protein AAGL24_28630 [Pseudomonadota bacterium]
MANDKSSSSGGSGSSRSSKRGKRKPVTIDLKATEVESDKKQPASGDTQRNRAWGTTAKAGDPAAKPTAETPDKAAAETETDKQTAAAEDKAPAGPVSEAKPASKDAPKPGETGKTDVAGDQAPQGAKAEAPKEATASGTAAAAAPAKQPDSVKKSDARSDKPAAAPKAESETVPVTQSEAKTGDQKPAADPVAAQKTAEKSAPEKSASQPEVTEKSAVPKKSEPVKPEERASTGGNEPPPPPPSAAAPSPRRGVGMFGLLAASLVGGLVVAGALYGLFVNGSLPIATKAEMESLQKALEEAGNEVAILESRLDETQEIVAENARTFTSAVDGRIDLVEQAVDALAVSVNDTRDGLQSTFDTVMGQAAERAEAQAERGNLMADRLTGLEESTTARQRSLNAVTRDLALAGDRLDRVEALQTDLLDLRKLVETGAAGSDVALASLEESINGLRDRVNALAEASSTAVIDARLAALEASTGGVDVVARRLGTLEAEVDTIATRVAEALRSITPAEPKIDEAVARGLAGLEPRLSALSADLAGLQSRLTSLDEAATTLAEETRAARDALAEKVDGNAAALATAALAGDLEAAVARLSDLETKVDQPGALDAATLAVAASRLKDAVDSGRPFATELAAVKSLTGEATDLSALEARADAGVPQRAAIIAAYPAVARAIDQAMAPPEPQSDDAFDQVLTGLRGLVRIRSVGEGDSETDTVGALSAAVKSGDLAEIQAAWEALPEPAKAVSGDWAEQVAARLTVDSMLETVTADVVNAVSGTTN